MAEMVLKSGGCNQGYFLFWEKNVFNPPSDEEVADSCVEKKSVFSWGFVMENKLIMGNSFCSTIYKHN